MGDVYAVLLLGVLTLFGRGRNLVTEVPLCSWQ